MTRGVLLSGMFRSGTTLASRILSASPRTLVVSDPFVYFFKAYRNFHLERAGATGWHPDEPTSDHFCSAHEDVNRAILDADLSERMSPERVELLRRDIRDWKTEQHPELCRKLENLRAGTFAEVYAQLIALSVDLYGTPATELAGTKVSWSEEFLPALSRAFPDTRFVLLVRDLRAVVASQNAMEGKPRGKRPLLFYVRHWRKSVAFTRRLSQHMPELEGRVLVLRYEDLVRDVARHARDLASFLDLSFDPAMTEAASFRAVDGRGGWQHNSSFETPGEGVYTNSLARWKEALSEAEVEAINALAGPELALLGYELPDEVRDPIECLGTKCEPDFAELATWIQPFPCAAYLRDDHARTREYALESVRRAVIEGEADLPGALHSGLFLDEDVLADLRASWITSPIRPVP